MILESWEGEFKVKIPEEKVYNFNKYIFWDTNISKINFKKRHRFIIERVLGYGDDNDIKLMFEYFSKREIKSVLKNMEYLNEWSLIHFCHLLKIDKKKTKSYGKKPLHWK